MTISAAKANRAIASPSIMVATTNRKRAQVRTYPSAATKNHFGELAEGVPPPPVAGTNYDHPFVVVMRAEESELLTSKLFTKKSHLFLHKREK
jgi:hypothetical protein